MLIASEWSVLVWYFICYIFDFSWLRIVHNCRKLITSPRSQFQTSRIVRKSYPCQLWCRFSCKSIDWLRVAYNDSYRILHNLPRCCNALTLQIDHGINTFDTLSRKSTFSIVRRCSSAVNKFI